MKRAKKKHIATEWAMRLPEMAQAIANMFRTATGARSSDHNVTIVLRQSAPVKLVPKKTKKAKKE